MPAKMKKRFSSVLIEHTIEDFFFFSWIGLAASQINIPFIFQFLWILWLLLILFSIVDTDRHFSRISWVPSFVIYHNSSFTRTVCIGSDILTCTGTLLLSNFASCYLWAVCINRSFDSLLNHVFISFGASRCKQKMAMGNLLLSRSQFLIMTLGIWLLQHFGCVWQLIYKCQGSTWFSPDI